MPRYFGTGNGHRGTNLANFMRCSSCVCDINVRSEVLRSFHVAPETPVRLVVHEVLDVFNMTFLPVLIAEYIPPL